MKHFAIFHKKKVSSGKSIKAFEKRSCTSRLISLTLSLSFSLSLSCSLPLSLSLSLSLSRSLSLSVSQTFSLCLFFQTDKLPQGSIKTNKSINQSLSLLKNPKKNFFPHFSNLIPKPPSSI